MIKQKVIDDILRIGGNHRNGVHRIIYNFMIPQTEEEYTDFIRSEFGTGGIGVRIDGEDYAVWYDQSGLKIVNGHSVREETFCKDTLSWEKVSKRIHELLREGFYVQQSYLDSARENELMERAEEFWYMLRDISDPEIRKEFFGDISTRDRCEELRVLRVLLDDKDSLADIIHRMELFVEHYKADCEIMRSHSHKPDRVLDRLRKFAKTYAPFNALCLFKWDMPDIFITEDEIDAFLSGSSGYSNKRLAIYTFFSQEKTFDEKVNYIKDQYGTGGQSHAVSGADKSSADYNSKGLKLSRGNYGKILASVNLKWPEIAKRVQTLIYEDRYLTKEDIEHMPDYEREQMANKLFHFYWDMPRIQYPYAEKFEIDPVKKICKMFETEPHNILKDMEVSLKSISPDLDGYDDKVKIYEVIKQYIYGEYSIFPRQEEKPEKAEQISLFDFL